VNIGEQHEEQSLISCYGNKVIIFFIVWLENSMGGYLVEWLMSFFDLPVSNLHGLYIQFL